RGNRRRDPPGRRAGGRAVRAPARSHRLPSRGKDTAMKGKLVRPAVVALAIVGALAAAGGIAYATIPDASGVIHACYNKTGQGTLRVLDTDKAQTCSNSEASLSWSQTGPQGVQGLTGPTGPTGPSDVYSVDGYNQGFKNVPKVPATETLATTPM